MTSEVEERPRFIMGGYSGIGVNGLTKKVTIHQLDFNLALTLGPRMGPVIMTYHSMK